jgi:hypothetical protein
MLNPDTTVKPGSIACLAAFLRSRPDAGIAGALIENEHGYCMTSAHADPSPLGELHGAAQFGLLSRWPLRRLAEQQTAEPRRCDWVSGACMVVRREVLESVGPLDEGYFLYFEEVDYCVRARRQGWSCWFVPAARVVHFEGASTGIRLARRRRPAYWYASRRRFFVKCYGAFGLLLADFLWAIGRLTLVLRRALRLGGRSGQDEEPARLGGLLFGEAPKRPATQQAELGRPVQLAQRRRIGVSRSHAVAVLVFDQCAGNAGVGPRTQKGGEACDRAGLHRRVGVQHDDRRIGRIEFADPTHARVVAVREAAIARQLEHLGPAGPAVPFDRGTDDGGRAVARSVVDDDDPAAVQFRKVRNQRCEAIDHQVAGAIVDDDDEGAGHGVDRPRAHRARRRFAIEIAAS